MSDHKPPQDLLDWLGITNTPNWHVARPLGILISVLLALLIFGAFTAAFTLLGRTIQGGLDTAAGNLGAGALIVAILGAPFLVWGTVIKQKTVTFQKESHITDRISKAVEQLGAEKTVDRIGRPVTIWTGEVRKRKMTFRTLEEISLPPRSKELSRSKNRINDQEDPFDGIEIKYLSWANEETVVEWLSHKVQTQTTDEIAAVGSWQAFTQTMPNIEVRIGGLLSLERIAQDSTSYDKGRDQVRVMEILCAYVRENAPVSTARISPSVIWEQAYQEEQESAEAIAAHDVSQQEIAFQAGEKAHQKTKLIPTEMGRHMEKWARQIPKPRADVQVAISILGRRRPEQRVLEISEGHGSDAGYQIDLRDTNLQKIDMSGLDFSNSRFERADISCGFASGVNLSSASLQGIIAIQADLRFANLSHSDLSPASNLGEGLRQKTSP